MNTNTSDCKTLYSNNDNNDDNDDDDGAVTLRWLITISSKKTSDKWRTWEHKPPKEECVNHVPVNATELTQLLSG